MSQNNQLPRIARLDNGLINQIAAGEVIERPSSVVKELVENAIDSGATRIDIHIDRGGTEKILITDNGCGIHPDDLELAIKRHTTSKLHDQKGLNAIRSLGFRGEALSSIASVCDFSIISRVPGSEHAVRLDFDPYTSRSKISPASANIGTTIEVIKLFQPMPVRRKFLRSPKTEYLHVLEVIKRFVLSQYEIDFRFFHNGKQKLACPACHQQYDGRISAILDKAFYQNAWYFDGSIENIKVCGWLGNAKTTRNQSDRQYTFLNNRIIKDKHINHAIRKAMDPVIHESRFPSYIIYLDIDPSFVDVNVHPTKQEVRFRSPRTVHDFIYALVSDVIRQNQQTISLPDNHPITTVGNTNNSRDSLKINDFRNEYSSTDIELNLSGEEHNPFGTPIVVLPGNILITKRNEDIRIIDLANLHKQYLLVLLSEQIEKSEVKSRPLLVPVNISLTEKELMVVTSHSEQLAQLGVEITQSGPGSLLVRSVPSMLPGVDINKFLNIFINTYQHSGEDKHDDLREILGLMVQHTPLDHQFTSLNDIKAILTCCHSLDLPFSQRNLKGFWQTLSSQSLLQMINNGK